MISLNHMKQSNRNTNTVYYYLFLWGHRTGCHQRSDRSFFWHGYQFPVCARCTGVILSYLISVPAYLLFGGNITLSIIAMGIMLLDWSIQFLGFKESTNVRRLITGIIGGYGVMTCQILGLKWLLSLLIH